MNQNASFLTPAWRHHINMCSIPIVQVFQCLVQGCKHKFQGAAERKQHLMDLHAFPPGFHFESMHLKQRRAQQGKLKVGTRKERRRMAQLQTAQLIIAKELATADALPLNHEAPAGALLILWISKEISETLLKFPDGITGI